MYAIKPRTNIIPAVAKIPLPPITPKKWNMRSNTPTSMMIMPKYLSNLFILNCIIS